MPHPEAYNHPTNHPDWTRRKVFDRHREDAWQTEIPVGIRILQNGVDYFRS
jgi:phosphoribosylformylglycinamidine synthase